MVFSNMILFFLQYFSRFFEPLKIVRDLSSRKFIFLDFESIIPVIPKYIGTRPYQQITFQYSLHIIEREGGELLHKEFLADGDDDPRLPLIKRLCADIPENVCVVCSFSPHSETGAEFFLS